MAFPGRGLRAAAGANSQGYFSETVPLGSAYSFFTPGARMRLAVLLLGMASLAGAACSRWRLEQLSSERSVYSPAARLHVSTRQRRGALEVVVDSGTLVAAGQSPNGAAIVGRDMYLTAFIAETRPASASALRSWVAIQHSDSALVAAELTYGSEVHVTRQRFVIPLPPNREMTTMWLGFQLTGEAVVGQARVADAAGMSLALGRPAAKNRIRVFVCSEHWLSGDRDSLRTLAMQRTYNQAC